MMARHSRALSILFPHPPLSRDHFEELAGSRIGCKEEGRALEL